MFLQLLRANPFTKRLIFQLASGRGRRIFNNIKPFIHKKCHILDLGAGTCNVSEILSNKAYKVVALDTKNLSFSEIIEPITYNGEKIPYPNSYFETTLILTVLHHTSDHIEILKEAKRVSKAVIVCEDVYNNSFQKYLTFFLDRLFNLEFFASHPHSNRTDLEWQKLFEKMSFKIVKVKYSREFFFFKLAYYFLQNNS